MKSEMSELTKSYKGARDFYPEDKRFQKWMFGVIRSVVEGFGYEEYDAPVLESTDLYRMKGSEEIINDQTYTFIDRGDRSVTMRTEMTPSVSRMVAARRQELTYPLRWYSIPNLFRYERPQKGRLREFWQLNVDIFGPAGIEADFETIQIADSIVQAFGAKRDMYTIKINSRLFTDFYLNEYLGLGETEATTLRRLIDRRSKISAAEFAASVDGILSPSEREAGLAEKLFAILDADSVEKLPEDLQKAEQITALGKLLNMLSNAGIANAYFDPSLMRGFDYYTDIVFEVFDDNAENPRSMIGGGRYDGLVGLFGVEPVETVGFGMGDAVLENFLRGWDLVPELRVETDIYVALIGDVFEEAEKAIRNMREEGVKVAVDLTNRKVGKQIESAAKKGIPYLMVIGEQEIKSGSYKLKDLKTGEEEVKSLERIISLVLSAKK